MNLLRKFLYASGSSLLFKGVRFADENLWLPTSVSETINFRSEWEAARGKTLAGRAKLWIHGASVGELEDLAAFFLSDSALSAAGLVPGDVMITAASVSARSRLQTWRNERGFLYCGPLPPDTAAHSRKFLAAYRPANLLLSHNDFWPNLFLRWRDSAFSKKFYWYFKPKAFTPARLKLFHAMRPISLARSQSARSNDEMQVVGNLRLDRVLSRIAAATSAPHPLDEWNAAPKPGATSIIVGSCRLEDAHLISKLNDDYFKAFRWVVIPHHTDSIGEVAQINQLLGDKCEVIVRQGLLVEAYRHFDLAWIGGGFSKSGSHNPLEAIAWGIPTICGPNIKSQIDAPHYVESGVLHPLADLDTVDQFFKVKGWIGMQPTSKAFAQTLSREESAATKLSKILLSGLTNG